MRSRSTLWMPVVMVALSREKPCIESTCGHPPKTSLPRSSCNMRGGVRIWIAHHSCPRKKVLLVWLTIRSRWSALCSLRTSSSKKVSNIANSSCSEPAVASSGSPSNGGHSVTYFAVLSRRKPRRRSLAGCHWRSTPCRFSRSSNVADTYTRAEIRVFSCIFCPLWLKRYPLNAGSRFVSTQLKPSNEFTSPVPSAE